MPPPRHSLETNLRLALGLTAAAALAISAVIALVITIPYLQSLGVASPWSEIGGGALALIAIGAVIALVFRLLRRR